MADYKSTLFAQMIKEFAENEVKPLAQEVDEEERFPVETVEKMAKSPLDFYKSIDCIFDEDNMDSITEIITLALSPIYRGNI